MKIIETYIRSKRTDGTACEDGYFAGNGYIAVVDGATSRGKYLWDHKTSGEYAKDLILSALADFDGTLSCRQFFEKMNGLFRSEYGSGECVNDVPISEQLRASVVVYSDFHKEIWVLGDCQCRINGRLMQTGKRVDFCIGEIRSMLIESLLAEGMTEEELMAHDVSRDMIEPLIDRQFFLENKEGEFGYPVLNGFMPDFDRIPGFKVQKGDVVILATDGYPFLGDDLADSETALKRLLEEDPLCYKKIKSTKGIRRGQCSFDDRCFVKFEV